MKRGREFLRIIDTTAPFFIRHRRESVNWSKAPLFELEKRGEVDRKVHRKIRRGFRTFLETAAKTGFNAITVDELCYMVDSPAYPGALRRKIRRYKKYYARLFSIAGQYVPEIFVTTDVIYRLTGETVRHDTPPEQIMEAHLNALFRDFPRVTGVVFRIGESDGVDVKGDFKSEIALKTPAAARKFLLHLLPLFERRGKRLIFRTWTVGAHPIGDLIWNERTYDSVFRGIRSPALLISLKYGQTDFFRFQELNPLFFRDSIPKILELQTRREYEGFGEFPNFPVTDYIRYRDLLDEGVLLAGIQVWSQTGGWSRFRNYTFLKGASLWNELNTFVCVRIFQKGISLRKALKEFVQERDLDVKPAELERFLLIADRAVRNILYHPPFGEKTLYFNRSRIPSLLHVTWDRITVNDAMSRIYNMWESDPEGTLRRAREALTDLKQLKRIAKKGGIKYDHRFHYDTFRLFYTVMRALLGRERERHLSVLERRARQYERRYPQSYRISISLERTGSSSVLMRVLFRLVVRETPHYRILDRILFNRATAPLYMLLFRRYRHRLPDFLDQQAMPLRHFLD